MARPKIVSDVEIVDEEIAQKEEPPLTPPMTAVPSKADPMPIPHPTHNSMDTAPKDGSLIRLIGIDHEKEPVEEETCYWKKTRTFTNYRWVLGGIWVNAGTHNRIKFFPTGWREK